MTETQNLLAEFVQNKSDDAFSGLVTCYVDLVYSTALRLVAGDAHLAEDVSQTVFVDLARMAPTLSKEVRLGGWLHRHTCFVASTFNRGERRRQSRERQAAEMNTLQDNSEAGFSLVAPILDEAINELGEEDRTAILLRFFERQDLRSVGLALGVSEDAARMRVTRALDKLQGFLKSRGVATSAGGLALVLSANAVHSAPVHLAVAISTAANLAAGATGSAATSTIGTVKTIAMTTMQKNVVAAVLAAAVGGGIFEARQAFELRAQNQTLQQQQKPMTDQIAQLQRDLADAQHDRDNAVQKLASLTQDNERLNRNTSELLRLRAEVGQRKTNSVEQSPTNPIETEAKAWLARIDQLKQRLGDTHGSIPELQFLTDKDWLEITENIKLDSDNDFRSGMSELRRRGDDHMHEILSNALRNYMGANNGQWPTDISQLSSYLSDPMYAPMLQRWEVLSVANWPDQNQKFATTWLITEKAPVDAQFEGRTWIDGPDNGGSSSRGPWTPAP